MNTTTSLTMEMEITMEMETYSARTISTSKAMRVSRDAKRAGSCVQMRSTPSIPPVAMSCYHMARFSKSVRAHAARLNLSRTYTVRENADAPESGRVRDRLQALSV